MKRDHLKTSLILVAAVFFLASTAHSQLSTEHHAAPWLLREKAKVEQRIAENRQREIVAQDALARAQNALANTGRMPEKIALLDFYGHRSVG